MIGARLQGPGRGPFLTSVAVHVVVLLLVWWSGTLQADDVVYEVIQIDLVSPPPAVAEEENPDPVQQDELVVERPDEEPVQPEEESSVPDPVSEETATPEPETVEETLPPPPDEPAEEESEPVTTTDEPPEDPPDETGEGINVRLEGLRRDYPEYYNNIIRQIGRCFRPSGRGDLTATVRFYINRDGTVSDLSVVERSGDFTFDIEAMGAVECAGQRSRLGPLPDELPYDILPIEFTFRPPGAREALSPGGSAPDGRVEVGDPATSS